MHSDRRRVIWASNKAKKLFHGMFEVDSAEKFRFKVNFTKKVLKFCQNFALKLTIYQNSF